MFNLFCNRRRRPSWRERIERKVNAIMSSFDDLNNALDQIGTRVSDIKSDTQSLLDRITQLQQNPPTGMTPDQQAALDTAVQKANEIAGKVTELDNLVPSTATTDQGATGGTETQGGDTGAAGSTGGTIDPNAPVEQPAGQEPGIPPVASPSEPLPDANAADQTVGNENPTT